MKAIFAICAARAAHTFSHVTASMLGGTVSDGLATFDQVTSNTGITLNNIDPTKPYIGPAPVGQLGCRGSIRQNWNRFFDLSLVKRTRIRETMNLEFRATALNVFNMTNFGTGASGTNYNNIGSAFGQVSGACRDISGTVEPGGRILEFMLRFNF